MTDGGWIEIDDSVTGHIGALALVPGNEVRLKDGTVYLVGDINEAGGTCGCCAAVSEYRGPRGVESDDDVVAYRVAVRRA